MVERRIGRRKSDRIILASGDSQRAVDTASALARTNETLLILGPDGSGRQHYARAIHEWSQRAGGPLVVVASSATPETLQARELFGCTEEADPLASGGADGALARAADGTLVIERIDLLSDLVRQRLSQALREGSYRSEGAQDATPLRTRVIGTAESDGEYALGDASAQAVSLSPLADRREDILPLAAHFLAEFAEEEGLAAVGFTVDARRWLVEELWLGNVRELRERIRQAVRLSGSGSVSAEALMLSTEGDEVPSFKEAKRAFETRYVEGLLMRCSGNISRAARLAKKDRKDFYDVIRRTGVDPTRFRS
jgi:two-component system response regulator GlrR